MGLFGQVGGVGTSILRERPTRLISARPSCQEPHDPQHLTRAAFESDPSRPRVYWLKPPAEALSALSFQKDDGVCDIEEYFDPSPLAPLPVTFDRATWDESDDADLVFLTYGTPELAALLPADTDNGRSA